MECDTGTSHVLKLVEERKLIIFSIGFCKIFEKLNLTSCCARSNIMNISILYFRPRQAAGDQKNGGNCR